MVDPKPVPADIAARLRDLGRRAEELRRQRDETVVEALKAGASVRAVAEAVGMAKASVQKIGEKAGWPDAKEKARRQAERDRQREWREAFDRDIANFRPPPAK